VGRLPLAVELVAAQAADGHRLEDLRDDLRQEVARLETLDLPGADEVESERKRKRCSLRASVNLSLDRLKPERLGRFAWLGVTPGRRGLHARMAATLWRMDERKAWDELRLLRDKALLLNAPEVRTAEKPVPAFRLHYVLHDAARKPA